ncbi:MULTISPECIES: class I adenylate-forming enzyme family protein [unclassified Nocardioides]|uniref:class I adenylate-forming enzyme family protein n=1 Tax=unclassified Nocardioides TaxID=2615069 RepID=UPI00361BE363
MRPGPDVRTLAELCLERARTHAARPAVADDDGVLTYAELAERALDAAAVLTAHGVRPGARVALQARNSADWVVAAFGALLAGAALVPVGHGASLVERGRVLAGLDPVVLVHDASLPAADGVRCLTLADVACPRPGVRRTRPASVDGAAAALVLSTSGTTGAVKSVPMTHEQLLRLYAELAEQMTIRETDRFLVAVPLAHSFGFNGLLLVAMLGGAMIRVLSSYDRAVVAEVVGRERLTVLAGPPTIYHDLEDSGPLPSARLAIAGGQVVRVGELVDVARSLAIPELVVGYGMTETCGTVALARVPTDVARDSAPMLPLPGVDVVVRDELGQDVVGAPGRVLVRGYNIARTYGVSTDPPGGWFDTGDLGVIDAEGQLLVVGRRSDMVIVSGFNVHPGEVETVLAADPDVAQVAVTGVPDRRRGQRLVAFVVPRGATVDVSRVDALVRERLSAYKVPSDYHVVDDLPVTSTGKLARSALRELAERWTASR